MTQKRKRRNHKPEFKARVAREALRGIKTISEIAQEYELHPVQVSEWKKQLTERESEVFQTQRDTTAQDFEREREKLHQMIGQLKVENDFLKKSCKKLGIPLDD